MRRITAPSAILALLLAVTAVTGCSVSVVDPAASPSEEAPQEHMAEHSPTPTDTEPEKEEAQPSASSGLSAEAQEQRDFYIDSATTTMPCPDGPLLTSGTIIRVEGACASLDIQLDAGVVIADDVDELTLSGSGTVVFAEQIGVLTVTGDANSVLWAGSTPEVRDTGTANAVGRG